MARGDQHLKMRSGTGGTVRWVKHSLCKHEDWSLDPQSHINARWVWQPPCKPCSRGRDAGSFQANLLARLAELADSELK